MVQTTNQYMVINMMISMVINMVIYWERYSKR